MIFERLADIIWKRSKLIIAIWIILLICAVPGLLKVGEVLDYSTDNMAGPHAESLEGMDVMDQYFGSSSTSIDSAAILVVSFNSAGNSATDGEMGAMAIGNLVKAELSKFTYTYKDENGEQQTVGKIIAFQQYGTYYLNDDPSTHEGVALYAIVYNSTAIDNGLIVSDDTQNLRDFIGNVISENNISGVTTYVTGSQAITFDTSTGAAKDISKIDVFSILMILILVGLFFRSFVTSAMPPITIGAAFGIAMCVMFLIGSFLMNIPYMVEMMLVVSMLGAGCDYCIFILARYREERVRHGADHEHALKSAVTWAGESITTSGIAVIIGFGAMTICSFSMVSSMGVVLAIGIIIALLAALTLISSILALAGEKLFWPTRSESLREGGKADRGWHGKVARIGHRYFLRSVKFSIKRAKIIILAAVLITVPAVYIMSTSQSSYDMVGAMSSGEAIDGLQTMEGYSNGGAISPNYGVFELNDSIGEVTQSNGFPVIKWADTEPGKGYLDSLTVSPTSLNSEDGSLYSQLTHGDDNVGEVWGVYQWSQLAAYAAAAIGSPTATMSNLDYTIAVYSFVATHILPNSLGKQVMIVLTSTDPMQNIVATYSAMTGAAYNDPTLTGIMDYVVNSVLASSVGGTQDAATGSTPITFVKYTLITKDQAMADRSMDTIKFMDGKLNGFVNSHQDMIKAKWLTGSAAVMYEISEQVNKEFLKVEVLAVVLILILLFFVMKSYVTPFRSVLTILMSVVWTVAITHIIFGSILGDGVMWIIPIILIVVCLGLGMDYDILLTTRIKENRLYKGKTNDEAITYAVTHSGSVITICGLIMGGAFGTLMLSSTSMLQQFGFALCFAILVDALLVRTYIVPAAMHLLGDLNWKGPKILHRNTPKQPE